MKKILLGNLGCLAVLLMSSQAWSQTAATPGPSGTATVISAAEIKATAEKDPPTKPLSDWLLTVDDINDEYNVGVAILHRGKPKGTILPNGLEHSEITEVYIMLSGSATLVTGGTMENVKKSPRDNGTIGPTFSGGPLRNGVTREVGPGDVVIIPPNTPHYFSEIKSDEITYLCDRIDPHRVLHMPGSSATSSQAPAQMGETPGPTGTAVDIKAPEIQAAAEQTGRGVVQMLRVVDINNGEYNLGIALLHRTPEGDSLLTHNSITEIYHILSGKAIISTGGTIDNPKVSSANPDIGPGFSGKTLSGGADREVGTGDVVIIPPNTPHYFRKVETDKIVYLVVRVDPHHVLSMPATAAAASVR